MRTDNVVKESATRSRLTRAWTVPDKNVKAPVFGLDFTKKFDRTPAVKTKDRVEEMAAKSTVNNALQPLSSTDSFMKRYGRSGNSSVVTTSSLSNLNSQPPTSRSPQDIRARPGSVFIPRRTTANQNLTSTVDEDWRGYVNEQFAPQYLGGSWTGDGGGLTKTADPLPSSTLAAVLSPKISRNNSITVQNNKVRFASPAAMSKSILEGRLMSPSFETPDQSEGIQQQQQNPGIPEWSHQQPVLSQPPSAYFTAPPATFTTPSHYAHPVATSAVQQQPLLAPGFSAQSTALPGAPPAFAVIAQDSIALQALLSGDLGGRSYIIQTLGALPFVASQMVPQQQPQLQQHQQYPMQSDQMIYAPPQLSSHYVPDSRMIYSQSFDQTLSANPQSIYSPPQQMMNPQAVYPQHGFSFNQPQQPAVYAQSQQLLYPQPQLDPRVVYGQPQISDQQQVVMRPPINNDSMANYAQPAIGAIFNQPTNADKNTIYSEPQPIYSQSLGIQQPLHSKQLSVCPPEKIIPAQPPKYVVVNQPLEMKKDAKAQLLMATMIPITKGNLISIPTYEATLSQAPAPSNIQSQDRFPAKRLASNLTKTANENMQRRPALRKPQKLIPPAFLQSSDNPINSSNQQSTSVTPQPKYSESQVKQQLLFSRPTISNQPLNTQPKSSPKSVFSKPDTCLQSQDKQQPIYAQPSNNLTLITQKPTNLKSNTKPQPIGTQSHIVDSLSKNLPKAAQPPDPHQQLSLSQYYENIKQDLSTSPVTKRAIGAKRIAFASKSKSLPESEHLKIISGEIDPSIISVVDRARMWQVERAHEEAERAKGYNSAASFVDHDLVACGDELIPVEDRVRAFDTGRVAEENEAEKRRLHEHLEEGRNRRIQEQLFNVTTNSLESSIEPPRKGSALLDKRFTTTSRPKLIIPERMAQPQQPYKKQPVEQQSTDKSIPPSPQVLFGDTLTKLSVKEKGSLFTKRPGGGRPVKLDRGSAQRRKTQPISFDDMARANQKILDNFGNMTLESPMGSCKDDDLDLGSILSSPTASVISDYSEVAQTQSPKPRLRIF